MAGNPIILNKTVSSNASLVRKYLSSLIVINSEYSGAAIIVVGALISKLPENSLRVNSSLISSIIFLEFGKSYPKTFVP